MYQGTYQPPTRFSVFPPVIKNLLILNVLVFLAQIVPETNRILINWFGLWPLGGSPIIGLGEFWPWQLLSYGFLHGSPSHLLFNMFALWMFGVQIENTWGSQRFLAFYFACVIGAALIQMPVVTWDFMASGGSALVGAYDQGLRRGLRHLVGFRNDVSGSTYLSLFPVSYQSQVVRDWIWTH